MPKKRAAPIIGSRNELHKLMEKTININLRSMEERGEYAEYAVKTNIIEANCRIEDIPTKIFEYNVELKKTSDKFLYVMVIRREGESFVLYLDTFFSRFWKLYNIEESSIIDRFIDQFTNNILRIDSLWMPHQMLNELEKGFKNVGFSIRFKQEVLNEEELSEEEISQLSLRLWSKGSKPSNEIVALLEKNGFPTTKTSTRLLDETSEGIKFLDEVYYDGKITVSKGIDIEEHVQFVDRIIDEYAKKMIMIETERIYLEPKSNGLKVHGSPFELKFSRNQSIEKLAIKLTNSTKPFRIWGVVHDKDENFLRIAGVDTHTGDKFDVDLMPEYGRIYLPKNACGNLIFRLYTNIQHALDPGVIIYGENGRLF